MNVFGKWVDFLLALGVDKAKFSQFSKHLGDLALTKPYSHTHAR